MRNEIDDLTKLLRVRNDKLDYKQFARLAKCIYNYTKSFDIAEAKTRQRYLHQFDSSFAEGYERLYDSTDVFFFSIKAEPQKIGKANTKHEFCRVVATHIISL